MEGGPGQQSSSRHPLILVVLGRKPFGERSNITESATLRRPLGPEKDRKIGTLRHFYMKVLH
jgi:hypothetical protein